MNVKKSKSHESLKIVNNKGINKKKENKSAGKKKKDNMDIIERYPSVFTTPVNKSTKKKERAAVSDLSCPGCNKVYKTPVWFNKHLSVCSTPISKISQWYKNNIIYFIRRF